jgi:hypothetical protein
MNYLKKCIISKLESDIYNSGAYDIGKMIAEVISSFDKNDVEGGNIEAFQAGIKDGLGIPDGK